jgi:hypothetical protein
MKGGWRQKEGLVWRGRGGGEGVCAPTLSKLDRKYQHHWMYAKSDHSQSTHTLYSFVEFSLTDKLVFFETVCRKLAILLFYFFLTSGPSKIGILFPRSSNTYIQTIYSYTQYDCGYDYMKNNRKVCIIRGYPLMEYLWGEKICICGLAEVFSPQKDLGFANRKSKITNPEVTTKRLCPQIPIP